MSNSLLEVLKGTMKKEAFEPPMPAQPPAPAPPPMDAGMAGGAPPPMDPTMAGGAPPPMPPPMAAPPAAPPAEAGAPMGGPPPMDPQMMQQLQMLLMDPNIQAMLQSIGIMIDPQQGPVDMQTGEVIPPEEMMQILQEIMMQSMPQGGAPPAPGGAPMPPPEAGGMPPKMAMEKEAQPMPMEPPPAGAPVAPAGPAGAPPPPMEEPPMAPPAAPAPGGDIEERLSALEDLVGELAAKLEVNPETRDSVITEGLTDEAKTAISPEGDQGMGEAEKIAEENTEESSVETMKNPEDKDSAVEEPEEQSDPEEKPQLIGDVEEEKQPEEKTAGEKPIEKKASSARVPTAAQKLTKLIGRLKNAYNN